jgi:60 kDa SS-A/Ro ribonucleoprotein
MERFPLEFPLEPEDAPGPVPGQMIPVDPREVRNAAGGWVFPINEWSRFLRFLIIGTEGGTYYVPEERLQTENLLNTAKCLREDGPRAVEITAQVAESRRAYKTTPALWALAMAMRSKDLETRRAAATNFLRVVRTGADLLNFAAIYLHGGTGKEARRHGERLGGTGRLWRAAIKSFFFQDPEKVAFQVAKYKERSGVSMVDLLRLSHPKFEEDDRDRHLIARWVLGGLENVPPEAQEHASRVQQQILAYELAKQADSEEELIRIIETHRLTWEMIPSEKRTPRVWRALLPGMPAWAFVRNLGYLTAIGVLDDREALEIAMKKIGGLPQSPVHPLRIMLAALTYERGKGMRREWRPIPEIVQGLNWAYRERLGQSQPIGKPFLLALDISGSMWGGETQAGIPPIYVAAAFGLYVLWREPEAEVIGVDTKIHPLRGAGLMGRSFEDMTIHWFVGLLEKVGKGSTDLSLPFQHALERVARGDAPPHAIVTFTDNETWAGREHPFQVLRQLRGETNVPVRAVNIAATATGYSILEPDDPLAFEVVGFDAAVVDMVSEIIAAEPPLGYRAE